MYTAPKHLETNIPQGYNIKIVNQKETQLH